MPAGRPGGVILVNPGISGVFLKTGPGTPLGVASLNLNLNLSNSKQVRRPNMSCNSVIIILIAVTVSYDLI